MNLKKTSLFVFSMLLFMLAVPSALHAADYVPKIIAGVVKADSWTMENNREGIYQLEAKEGGQLQALTDSRDVFLAPLGGAVYQDGTMYGIHFKQEYDPYEQANTYTIYSVAYDMQSWQRTKGLALSNMYGNLISSCGITHDPVTGLNFGIFYNFNMSYQVINRKLATIDFVNTEVSGAPKKEVIGIVETPFAAIAASENGFLYGVGQDGWLYIIDKVKADETATSVEVFPIGDLGISDISTNPSSMTFDPRTKKLYWSYVSKSQKSFLYEINYNIGQVKATKIMQVPDNAYLVNMYIAPMQAADDAPAAVSSLAATFQGEQTVGTVSFAMPTKTYASEALAGQLSYTILADDTTILATGQAQAGALVEKQVSVDSEGREVQLTVVAGNDKGQGAPKSLSLYIGRDTPLAVQNLRLSYNNETEFARLTWDAPTMGTHGKELTQYNLAYNIVRQPDNVVVAQGLKLTGFSEKLEKTADLKSYSYQVVAINGKHYSDTATTASIVVGQALVPPFDEDFTTQQGFDRFTVVDANNDATKPQYSDWQNTWVRFHKYYTYSGTTADHAMINSKNAANDYLLTPPLQLAKGGSYEFRLTAKQGYSGKKYNQHMRILVGPAGGDLADYEVVKDTFVIDDVNLIEYMTNIAIKTDGIYQIALHAVSKAETGELYVDELHLAASLLSTAPDSVTNLVAKADAQGYLKATVSFTAPATTLHGDALTAISHIDVIDVNDRVLGTILNPTPGAPCTIEASNMMNGINTYYVVAYADEAPGAKAAFTLFVGQDYPTEPTQVELADNGTEAVLTWKAPTEGYNGLPLNPSLLSYNLYTISADGYPTLAKSNIQSPYNTGVKTNEGEQQLLYYAIDAKNSAGYSELVPTNGLVVGQPYQLPYHDGFDKTNQLFTWIEGDYADWNIGLVKMSSDDDGYAMCFEPNRADYGFYNLGKISLAGAQQPVLSFSYYAIPSSTLATMGVAIDTDQNGETMLLKQIDMQAETKEEWKRVEIDLSQFRDKDYIIVKFAMVSLQDVATQIPLVFDNLTIEDAALAAISTVSAPAAGQPSVFRLDGTRLSPSQQLRPGLYIINGRKTLVK